MSALLTDGAVREAARYAARPRSSDWGERLTGPRIEALFGAVLDFHATEGREALVEAVARAEAGYDGYDLHDVRPLPRHGNDEGWARSDYLARAEAVVTALVGEQSPDGRQTNEEQH